MMMLSRTRFDTSVATWSPAGRVFQIEYAMEAVNRGSAAVGLRSTTHVVLASISKVASSSSSSSGLSSHHNKISKIDEHVGVAVAGVGADGRVLSRHLLAECVGHRFVYGGAIPVGRLVVKLADKAQACTRQSHKRPYGVGLLVGGFDESGPHLYYNCPSGNYFEYQAFAIGSRSQAANEYLESRFKSFANCSRDELVWDALLAFKETLQGGEKLTGFNCTVAVVGVGEAFHVLNQNAVQKLLESHDIKKAAPAAAPMGM